MKSLRLTTFLALIGAFAIQAQEKGKPDAAAAGKNAEHAGHDHEKKKAGPNGGRLLTSVEPHAEFFVTKDRKVQITFVGDDNKAVAPAAQTVTVTAGERSKPVKLTFTKSGNALVSDKALPEGNDFPTVVQIKATATAKPVLEKFNLNMEKCPTCEFAEYACTCEHGEEGPDHKDEKKKKE